MGIEDTLKDIWSTIDMNWPIFIQQYNYRYCKNEQHKEVLVLGVNSSFDKSISDDEITYSWSDIVTKYQYEYSYYKRVCAMLQHQLFEVNLLNQSTYIDLLYYLTNDIKRELDELLDNLDGYTFVQSQLELTQKIIEDIIQPKVIIVNSLTAFSFLQGSKQGLISSWYGYKLDLVESTASGCSVYEITGICEDCWRCDDFRSTTNLIGTYIIVYPTLSSGEFPTSQKVLEAWEIQVYLDLYDAKSEEPIDVDEVDVEILSRYPYVYQNIKKSQQQGKKNCVEQYIVQELISFRKMSVSSMWEYIVKELLALELLEESDLDLLADKLITEEEFDSEIPLICLLPKGVRYHSVYFETIYQLKGRRFILHKQLEEKNRDLIVDWYMNQRFY